MNDLVSRQALLDKFEPWLKVKDYNTGELNMLKAILYEIRFASALGTNLAEVGTDLISRQAAKDALNHEMRCGAVINQCGLEMAYEIIEDLPSTKLSTNLAQVGTELATKRAVKGFPIDADLLMLKVEEEYGFRARDRLYEIIRYMPKYELPSAEPERVWSELDKQLIDALLLKIYELQGTSLSMDGVVAKKYYIEELYSVLFGRGEKPRWMT